MRFALAVIFIFSFASQARAVSQAKTFDAAAALALPLENRERILQNQGPASQLQLERVMFDESASIDLRWRAVVALAKAVGPGAKPDLEKAIQSKEWFMRNAALIAFESVDQDAARLWARKLLSDKALVVRSAAVDTLAHLHDSASQELLWEKINARENFRGTQSLWIRRQIADVLSAMQSPGDEKKFIALLSDRDETLQAAAIKALERRTGSKLGKDGEPTRFKRAYWMNWANERQL